MSPGVSVSWTRIASGGSAGRIAVNGVADRHEPLNGLAGSGHGLHGAGCAGPVYNGFPGVTGRLPRKRPA